MHVLGYNQLRPEKKNYSDFETKLVSGISNLNIPGLSLFFYGSYTQQNFVPGRSDIDAVLVFPDDVVIDKKNLLDISDVLSYALEGNDIPLQITPTDITTMRDGRFNTYDGHYEPFFREKARQVLGPDYRPEFRYALPTLSEQTSVKFNLRKVRSGLLFSKHDRTEDYKLFLKKFNKSLDAISRASSQILFFLDGNSRDYRFSALEVLSETHPELNLEVLSRIKRLYSNLDELDALYTQPEEILSLWCSGTSFMEQMLRIYLKQNPRK